MDRGERRSPAFTLLVISVLFVALTFLVGLIQMGGGTDCGPGALTRTATSAREIAFAGACMAMDHVAHDDPKFGWAGDLYARVDDACIRNVKDYLARLVELKYLDLGTLVKAGDAPGFQGFTGKNMETFDPALHCPFKVFKLTGSDGQTAISLTTRNLTYGRALGANAPAPFNDKGFVVVHKMGDGAHFRGRDAAVVEKLGLLPGRKNHKDRPIETPEDYLSFQ